MTKAQTDTRSARLGATGVAESQPGLRPHPRPPVPAETADFKRVLGLPVPVTAILAERDMNVESILAFRVGTIVEFETSFDSALELRVADRKIGAGYAVKLGEHFGLRITRIIPVEERIESLGRGPSSSWTRHGVQE